MINLGLFFAIFLVQMFYWQKRAVLALILVALDFTVGYLWLAEYWVWFRPAISWVVGILGLGVAALLIHLIRSDLEEKVFNEL